MKIEDALKLSDIVVTSFGLCVYRIKDSDWYYHDDETRSLHDLAGMYMSNTTWQPAYVRPQFKIGDKVSFLQACLSGQCFLTGDVPNARRCVDIVSGKTQIYTTYRNWCNTTMRAFCPSDICTIVADPSQEQPEPAKRQRTHAEIVADIKTLVSELEEVK